MIQEVKYRVYKGQFDDDCKVSFYDGVFKFIFDKHLDRIVVEMDPSDKCYIQGRIGTDSFYKAEGSFDTNGRNVEITFDSQRQDITYRVKIYFTTGIPWKLDRCYEYYLYQFIGVEPNEE